MVYELKVVFKKCTTVLHVDRFGVEKKIRGGGGVVEGNTFTTPLQKFRFWACGHKQGNHNLAPRIFYMYHLPSKR